MSLATANTSCPFSQIISKSADAALWPVNVFNRSHTSHFGCADGITEPPRRLYGELFSATKFCADTICCFESAATMFLPVWLKMPIHAPC